MLPSKGNSLEKLDLSYNELSHLENDVFSDMPALNILRLSANKIIYLYESTWSPIWEQLFLLVIQDNEIRCDQHLKWIFNYEFPFTFSGSCKWPEHLRGISLRHLKVTDLM
ncbi:chaoptin-like isoform X3 [Tachypleus tridentatus]|uniref:chaoptin-like isoform X3 n=1 Tax=Tachypleus tridentatus TaxID=6853 RepID=UPI003FD2CCC8